MSKAVNEEIKAIIENQNEEKVENKGSTMSMWKIVFFVIFLFTTLLYIKYS